MTTSLDMANSKITLPLPVRILCKSRSVPEQKKPYPPLSEAIANQVTFEYEGMKGTMVGFRMPESTQGTGVPGFHFHFISRDKTRGGHLLDCIIDQVHIFVDHSNGLEVIKPIIKN